TSPSLPSLETTVCQTPACSSQVALISFVPYWIFSDRPALAATVSRYSRTSSPCANWCGQSDFWAKEYEYPKVGVSSRTPGYLFFCQVPPKRVLASMISKGTPACSKRCAAAIPATPEPTISAVNTLTGAATSSYRHVGAPLFSGKSPSSCLS